MAGLLKPGQRVLIRPPSWNGASVTGRVVQIQKYGYFSVVVQLDKDDDVAYFSPEEVACDLPDSGTIGDVLAWLDRE